MAIKLRVSELAAKLRVAEEVPRMTVGNARVIYTGGEPYKGEYTVTPKTYEPVVLETANRVLSQDVHVFKIPQYEVSNEAGGVTLIMGDEYMNLG